MKVMIPTKHNSFKRLMKTTTLMLTWPSSIRMRQSRNAMKIQKSWKMDSILAKKLHFTSISIASAWVKVSAQSQ
jgi:hypothetical protein